jgi:5-methylcytosine-specific restriction endonuclease McrA
MSTLSSALEQQIVADAGHRCGYCLLDERLTGIPLSIEHIIPESRGGTTTRENLWRSCRPCNEFKRTQTEALDPETNEIVPLFNPRAQPWENHFVWSNEGIHIIGITAIGRATIGALQLNRLLLVRARSRWVAVGWHPPGNE